MVAERLERLRERLAAAGGPDVDILAVTKGHPVRIAERALAVGLTDLGENYAQELDTKMGDLSGDRAAEARWHFIGRLQSNKVRLLGERVAVWQSVDRLKLGREIAKRAPGAKVMAQVNIAGEGHKGGCAPEGVAELVEQLDALGLEVVGLMAVGSHDNDAATARGFAAVRRLVDDLALPTCSMGMTADLEIAVAEGSNMVRVGTALFGPRQP